MSRTKIIEKVQALLAKTVENGCTQEEMLAAVARARAMMDAYEITEDDLRLSKEEEAVLRAVASGPEDPHDIKAALTTPVAEFCDCEGWRAPNGFVFCGLRSDADFASWLLDALAGHVLAELANRLMGCLYVGGRRWRVINGFVEGCTGRIAERLVELRRSSARAATDNSRALVVIKNNAVAAKMEKDGIKLQEGSARRERHYDDRALADGRRAGDRANFGRPVDGAAGVLRLTGR